MTAYFIHDDIEYRVTGPRSAVPGDADGLIVTREDDRPIPGATMHPGMVQTGVPDDLLGAAEAALDLAREVDVGED